MLTNYKKKEVLNDFYYNGDQKLMKRIDMWNNFGTNPQTYGEFIHSLINKRYDNYADLGCGNAYYSSELLEYINEKAYFVDVSKNILTNAEERVNTQSINLKIHNIKFLVDDITNTKIDDSYIDLITMMHVLQHVDKIDSALEEIRRIAKPNAEVIITTYNNSLEDWINKTHYDLIEKLNFPTYMFNKSEYLKFAGDNAELILSKKFSNIKRSDYNNDAVLKSKDDVMNYYVSSMMYRMSKGEEDSEIGSEKWNMLRNMVESKVIKELEEKGCITIEGNVTAFKIKL